MNNNYFSNDTRIRIDIVSFSFVTRPLHWKHKDNLNRIAEVIIYNTHNKDNN